MIRLKLIVVFLITPFRADGKDRQTVASLKGIDSDTISIAAPHVFSLRLLPDAIRMLRLRQSVAAVHLKSGTYGEVANHVLEGRADIGLSRLPLDENVFDWRR